MISVRVTAVLLLWWRLLPFYEDRPGTHRRHTPQFYKQNLVRAICEFGDCVGSNVLAEGIETIEELRTVFQLGARYAQGYYMGRPVHEPQGIEESAAMELRQILSGHFSRNFLLICQSTN